MFLKYKTNNHSVESSFSVLEWKLCIGTEIQIINLIIVSRYDVWTAFPFDPHRWCFVACRETLMQNIVGFQDTTLQKKTNLQRGGSKIDACSCLTDVPLK